MPVRIIEGIRGDDLDQLSNPRAERRFQALAHAVRAHESRRRAVRGATTDYDEALYRSMRQLSGDAESSDRGAA